MNLRHWSLIVLFITACAQGKREYDGLFISAIPQHCVIEQTSPLPLPLPLYVHDLAFGPGITHSVDGTALIQTYISADQQALFNKQPRISVDFKSEMLGLPLFVGASPASIINLCMDIARWIKTTLATLNRLPNNCGTFNANAWASFCINERRLSYPFNNAESSYFNVFTPEIRMSLLHDYALYEYSGYIDFLKSFPEFEAFVERLHADQARFNMSLDYHEVSEKKQQIIKNVVANLSAQIKEKRAAEFEAKEAERIALMEKTREDKIVKEELIYHYNRYAEIAQNNPDAPARWSDYRAIIGNFLDGNDKATYTETFSVDQQGVALLSTKAIPVELFGQCTGNNMQQFLHRGFLDLLAQAADIDEKDLQSLLVDGVIVGQEFNHAGYTHKAFSIANFCHTLVEHSKGLVEGAWHSVCNVAHAACHPIKTAQAIKNGAIAIGKDLDELFRHFNKTIDYLDTVKITLLTDRTLAKQMTKVFLEEEGVYWKMMGAAFRDRLIAYAKLTDRERGKLVGRLAMDNYLFGRALYLSSHISTFTKTRIFKAFKAAKSAQTAEEIALATAEGIEVPLGKAASENVLAQEIAQTGKIDLNYLTNQSGEAILKNGYYEINGFKFSERYYKRLWDSGRPAPSLIAKLILESPEVVVADQFKQGFYKYVADGWEMVYNPSTKEVWHLQPIRG